MTGPYDSLQAFRTALEARLRNVAQQQSIDLQRLQRHVAFERLLAWLSAGREQEVHQTWQVIENVRVRSEL